MNPLLNVPLSSLFFTFPMSHFLLFLFFFHSLFLLFFPQAPLTPSPTQHFFPLFYPFPSSFSSSPFLSSLFFLPPPQPTPPPSFSFCHSPSLPHPPPPPPPPATINAHSRKICFFPSYHSVLAFLFLFFFPSSIVFFSFSAD